jgi:hypothetical protein
MTPTETARHGFYIVPHDELAFDDFERFPVWSEHYDFDEIEEIISWGIDANWLKAQLGKLHDGSAHCYYPILQTTPRLPTRMHMSMKADITTVGGRQFKGIVPQGMNCLGIYHDGSLYDFNGVFQEMAEDNVAALQSLQEKLGSAEPIFPVRFTTGFFNSEGEPIEGTFSPTLPPR